MANPWLGVPLEVYEGHMRSPGVAQLKAPADLFEDALRCCRPESVAILGIAGGNGLDRVDSGVTRRILGVDIHPEYLDAVRQRYPKLPLTLRCTDLAGHGIQEAPVEMVHAALIFEHAGTEECLRNAVSLVAAGGYLSAVLQLRSDSAADVSPTPFPAIQTLAGHFQIIEPEGFRRSLEDLGFALVHEKTRALPQGKAFWLGVFRRPQA